MTSTILAPHQAATAAAAAAAAQFAQATTSAFGAQPSRFLPLDLAQSHNAVYQSLYNNAAAAAAFQQLSTNPSAGNAFFTQFPPLYANPAVVKNPFRSAFHSCASSASSSNSSITSNSGFGNQKKCHQDETISGSISTNVIVIPEPKPSSKPDMEISEENFIFAKSFNGFDISSALNKNSIANAPAGLPLLPKSNGIKIANGDYFGSNESGLPCRTTLVTSSTCDSERSSSSSSSSQKHVEVILAQEKLHKIKNKEKLLNTSSSHKNSLNPSSRVDKKRKELVRDDAYWERRRKNNDAAKRSRDSRRKKEDEIAVRAAILEQENFRLRFEVERLKGEIERHRLVAFKAAKLAAATTLFKLDENDDPKGVICDKFGTPSPHIIVNAGTKII